VDANQFVYWLKGITDTSAAPGPDTWAKIARKIDEVLAASNQKPVPPSYPVMRGPGGSFKDQYGEAVRQTNVEAYRDYPPKFAPENPAPITYPTVIASAISTANKETL